MDEKISITFTENNRYSLEFTPPEFWAPFAATYDALPWVGLDEGRLAIVAENYSYLLDILVQARLFYLSTRPFEDRFK